MLIIGHNEYRKCNNPGPTMYPAPTTQEAIDVWVEEFLYNSDRVVAILARCVKQGVEWADEFAQQLIDLL